MRPIELVWLSAGLKALNPVLIVQAQLLIQPAPTPPLPTEVPEFPGTHQMPSHLLFHPVTNERETSTRMPYRKVVDPTSKNRVVQHRS